MSRPASKPRPPLPKGPWLVVGLARSGQAAAGALAGLGEQVIGCDAGSPEGAAGLERVGVEVHLDGDGAELVSRARSVVKSPGVPGEAAAIRAARELGLPVLGELELGWRLLPNRFVAVTGTNGKTTVTELLGHIWRAAGQPVAVAGNVGTPVASLVGKVDPEATVVCECSSFQLEDAEAFAPECAVLLNLSPDHLDRHGSLDAYAAAKLRAFAHQGEGDVAVLNGSDPAVGGLEPGGRARRVAFCRGRSSPAQLGAECDVRLDEGTILAGGEPLVETASLPLLGEHNAQNAAAATAVALAMGIGRDAVARGLSTFPGVAHRLEPVGELGGVAYVNDSKATNVAAASVALLAFDGGVHAILGGSSKGEGFAELAPLVAARCAACYLIGETAVRIEGDLEPARRAGVALTRCDGLPEAVAAAAAAARPGDTVLLAPACASFDSYRDYEQRGEHFRRLVAGLEGQGR